MTKHRITFIEADGTSKTIDAEAGQSLMLAAVQNGVNGIVGECGGARVCGTCHCYVDEPWLAASGSPHEEETMMLEFSEEPRANSRLSCQVYVSVALDGMVVHVPLKQP